MGLDGVEIVLALEAAFAISISDDEAQSAAPVGDLVALIHDLAGLPSELGQPTFEKVASILAGQLHYPLELIHPDSSLAEDLGIGR